MSAKLILPGRVRRIMWAWDIDLLWLQQQGRSVDAAVGLLQQQWEILVR